MQLVTNQIGNHFLMGGAQAESIVVAISDAQQLRAISWGPAGLFPQLHGLYHRHQHFLGAGPVHLLTDNVLHLAQHAQAGGQPVIQAGGQLADHAGPQHELMADDNGIRWGFFHGGKQVLGSAHRRQSLTGYC